MSTPEHRADGANPQTKEELLDDIEQTREQLAHTVDALSDRLDVKGRAQARAQEIAYDPRTRYVGIGAAVAVVAVIALVVWRKKR